MEEQIEVVHEIEAQCRERGLRLTPTRKRVLEMVIAAEGPVKAYDLLDQLKSEQPKAAPPTVYRALDFLLQNHFIHRLESMNAFVSCFHPSHKHQGQFLICERCQAVIEINEPTLQSDLADIARRNQFKASRQVLEIYGTCSNCRDQ